MNDEKAVKKVIDDGVSELERLQRSYNAGYAGEQYKGQVYPNKVPAFPEVEVTPEDIHDYNFEEAVRCVKKETGFDKQERQFADTFNVSDSSEQPRLLFSYMSDDSLREKLAYAGTKEGAKEILLTIKNIIDESASEAIPEEDRLQVIRDAAMRIKRLLPYLIHGIGVTLEDEF